MMLEYSNAGYQPSSPRSPHRKTPSRHSPFRSHHPQMPRDYIMDEEDFIPTRDRDRPPVVGRKFQKENRGPRPRDFLRQESAKFETGIDHMQAEKDLSPPAPPPRGRGRGAANPGGRDYRDIRDFPVRDNDHSTIHSARYVSNGDNYDVNRSVHSAYDSKDTTPPSGDPSSLDRSTMSSRGQFDRTGALSPDIGAYNRSLLKKMELNRSMSTQERNEFNRSMSNDPYESNRSNRLDSNQSILSHHTHRSILSQNSNYMAMNGDLNRSNFSRDIEQSFTSHSTKIPTHQQNGIARPIPENNLSQSRRSLNTSRVTLYASKDYGVRNSLVNLGLVCVLSLLVAMVALQLIFKLTATERVGMNTKRSSVLSGNVSYQNTLEVALAMCSFVIMLDLCCLLVGAVQVYFAAKLLKVPQGEERAFRYLKECAPSRFIAVMGFFVSIPVLLLTLLLYIVMEFGATPAIISSVIFSLGLVFIIAAVIHSVFYWHSEKERADASIPAIDSRWNLNKPDEINKSEFNLSTLV